MTRLRPAKPWRRVCPARPHTDRKAREIVATLETNGLATILTLRAPRRRAAFAVDLAGLFDRLAWQAARRQAAERKRARKGGQP